MHEFREDADISLAFALPSTEAHCHEVVSFPGGRAVEQASCSNQLTAAHRRRIIPSRAELTVASQGHGQHAARPAAGWVCGGSHLPPSRSLAV